MALDTFITTFPDTLSESEIKRYRKRIKDCPNPYTQEEALSIPNDSTDFDINRYLAYIAIDLLKEYGIPITEGDDQTE